MYRYIRISNMSLPYRQNPCISGIRVFEHGEGEAPQQSANVEIKLLADEPMEAIDMEVCFAFDDCTGANILSGIRKINFITAIWFSAKQRR